MNFKDVNSALSTCMRNTKSHHQWSSDSSTQHGNQGGKKSFSYFTLMEQEILLRSYGEYERTFQQNAVVLQKQKRQSAWERAAAPSQCLSFIAAVY